MSGAVHAAPAGLRGFDCNTKVTPAIAAAYYGLGFRFCVRYVPRTEPGNPYDLDASEAQVIMMAGLGLMAVQHVKPENWVPTPALGSAYGAVAARRAAACGLPNGTSVWCDLEGVAVGTPAEQVIGYCNSWYDQVAAFRYKPGLYVGWHCGLTGMQLYRALKFQSYWAAYNLNAENYPLVRGVQMQQGAAKPGDRPAQHAVEIDTDVTRTDALGGQAMVWGPECWPLL